jgi:hypothetical protein
VANIYYSYSDNRTGVLRAILSSEKAGWLLKAYSAKYAGHQFPSTDHNSEGSFAVVRIFEGEGSEEWRVGFYFLHDDMMRIEEAVLAAQPGNKRRDGL